MPKATYALEENGPRRLEVSWKGIWKNVTVTLDGEVLGVIPTQKELKMGRSFTLPDGSALFVILSTGFGSAELRVTRNGMPLPGSASDPESRVKAAAAMVYFIGGLNIVLGLVALIFQVKFLLNLGLGVFSIAFGAVFLVLGFFTSRRSMVALILAIVIFAIDGVLGILASLAAGGVGFIGGLIFRVFLIIPMIQGVGAISRVREKEARAMTPPPSPGY